jgi:uncharacterized cofD-like protein
MTDPLRVVSIGGGHGLSCLLSGLKHYAKPDLRTPPLDITAVVTVTDDGGSSGRLRREFEILPPGDIRNCMVALSPDAEFLSQLFQYRFTSGRGLKGHSFGNLFLTALTDMMGDFPDAVRKSAEVLKIAGRIYPSTAADVSLEAELADGRIVRGETRISRSKKRIHRIRLVPVAVGPLADSPLVAQPMRETLDAILHADLITIGPGSLFTSIIPNLLVHGIPEAIHASGALKVYFMNLMSQPGETIGFTAADHVQAILDHAGLPILDSVVVNTTSISNETVKQYAERNSTPVHCDTARLEQMGLEIISADLLLAVKKVRHNPAVIAAVAYDLARRGRAHRLGKVGLAKMEVNG